MLHKYKHYVHLVHTQVRHYAPIVLIKLRKYAQWTKHKLITYKIQFCTLLFILFIVAMLFVQRIQYRGELFRLRHLIANTIEHEQHINTVALTRLHQNTKLENTLGIKISQVQSVDPISFVIVIPYKKSQLDAVYAMLKRWSEERYRPTDYSRPREKTNLVFFSADESASAAELAIKQKIKEYRTDGYFTSISFIYEKEQNDIYYNILSHNSLSSKYRYAFIMEPETTVIRSGWLRQLHKLAFSDKPFFVKGGICRSSVTYDYLPKMNKNAIYSFSKAYQELLADVPKRFGFDIDQYRYIFENDVAGNKFFHKYQTDDFLLDLQNKFYTESDIRARYPGTYFVSGGKSLETADRSALL